MMPFVLLTASALMCRMSPTECRSDDARTIAHAIDATTDDPGLRAHLVVYSYHESHWRLHPEPASWDALAGVAHGFLQLWGRAGLKTPEDQCRVWLWLVQRGGLAALDSSPRRAARRAARAARLLAE
jgi:hypothetical protein